MMWMHIQLLFIVLLGSGFAQQNDVDKLISSIFKRPIISQFDSPVVNLNTRTSSFTQKKSCGFGKDCVPHFLCKDGKVIKTGQTVIDVRFGGEDELKEEEECHYLEICCSVDDQLPSRILPQNASKSCGYRNVNTVDDASNVTQFGEFPWMVSLIGNDRDEKIFQCGGSLLAPTVILTAAHCVEGRENRILRVTAGVWDIKSVRESLPHQERQVMSKIVHPKFNKQSLINDVALLFVDPPFEWADNVIPICLPPANMKFDNSRCFATGWGKDLFGRDGKYQDVLKKVNLPVVPKSLCQDHLRSTRLGRFFQLDDSFICAGGEPGKDTCTGDGGSPLACPVPNVPNQFYQVGVVAWGIGCGKPNVPGVYANVPHLRSWIDEQLRARNIDV